MEQELKQKQIEEMAKVIMQPQDCKGYEDNRGCYFGNGKGCKKCKIERHENAQIMADYLYNAGYRKIPENAVVLTREEYEKLKDEKADNILANIDKVFKAEFADMKNSMIKRINKNYAKKVRKETAEKFAKLVEFHSVSTRDEEGREIFTISALGLKEILHEEFGIPYDEIAKEITEGKV